MDLIISVVVPSMILLFMVYDIFKEEKEISISPKEYAIVFIGFSILIFTFMFAAGVLDSGYHFVDDHEIYRVNSKIQQSGLFTTIVNQIKGDLHIRFRFTYWLIRTLQIGLLGTNFKLWHIMQSILVILSMFFSYVFARKMQVPVWLSCVFVVVIFIGRQSEVLWRLGPQENLGVLLLMLTLLSLIHYLENKRFLVISILLMFFLGGTKEAFLLWLPILPIWLLIIEYRNNSITEFSLKECWKIVKKRWILFVSAFLIFSVDIGIIYFIVGTNQIGYAGIDQTYGLKDYLFLIARICFRRQYFWFYIKMTLIGILGFLLPVSIFVLKKNKFVVKEYFTHMIMAVFVLGYIFLSQFVLHAKSGLSGRYIIPVVIGYALFWIVDMGYVLKRTGIRECIICYYIFAIYIAMGTMVECDRADSAYKYAENGKCTTQILDKIAEYKNQKPNILVAMDPELELSTSVYLQEKYDIKNVYNVSLVASDGDELYDGYVRSSEEKAYIYGEEVQIYVGYDNISDFMIEHGQNLEEYNSYIFGSYTMYVDKGIDDAIQE